MPHIAILPLLRIMQHLVIAARMTRQHECLVRRACFARVFPLCCCRRAAMITLPRQYTTAVLFTIDLPCLALFGSGWSRSVAIIDYFPFRPAPPTGDLMLYIKIFLHRLPFLYVFSPRQHCRSSYYLPSPYAHARLPVSAAYRYVTMLW